jgi:hypothetical protein
VAADGILVRENILFPSSPTVVEFQLAAPVGRMGRVLDGGNPNFCKLIAGKPCPDAMSVEIRAACRSTK